jgi:hypothetical protein
MTLFAIHDEIFLTPNIGGGYEYIKHSTRLSGDSATMYNMDAGEVAHYLKNGYKHFTIGEKNLLVKKIF